MIELMKVPIPNGEAIILTATIGGAITNTQRKDWSDIYTDTFPEGLTITLNLEDFMAVWMTCLISDYDDIDTSNEVH